MPEDPTTYSSPTMDQIRKEMEEERKDADDRLVAFGAGGGANPVEPWPRRGADGGLVSGSTGPAPDHNTLRGPSDLEPGSVSIADNQVNSVYAFGEPIVQIREHHVDLPEEGVKVGAVAFADAVAFIRTRNGWVNLGEAIGNAMPNPRDTNNNRRGAIEATRRKRAEREKNG